MLVFILKLNVLKSIIFQVVIYIWLIWLMLSNNSKFEFFSKKIASWFTANCWCARWGTYDFYNHVFFSVMEFSGGLQLFWKKTHKYLTPIIVLVILFQVFNSYWSCLTYHNRYLSANVCFVGSTDWSSSPIESDKDTITITRLDPGVEYEVRVVAVNYIPGSDDPVLGDKTMETPSQIMTTQTAGAGEFELIEEEEEFRHYRLMYSIKKVIPKHMNCCIQ